MALADFYMADLEVKLLNQDRVSNPIKYHRYVDDTICIFETKNHLHHFVNRLKRNSVLNFTHEIMEGTTFHFLDVFLSLQPDGHFDTSVYVKPTDKGLYMQYNSHTPEQYKKSVVNSLINRAFKLSSTEEARRNELSRVTQVLVNNGYPQTVVDRTIERKLTRLRNQQGDNPDATPHGTTEDINFYAQLHKVSSFREDTRRLKGLIDQHVSPSDPTKSIKLTTFYKPLKLASRFSTRPRRDDAEKSSLVYRFECPISSCNDVHYYGYTNQRLGTRVKQHRRKDSAICRHFMDTHNDLPPNYPDLIECFSIIFQSHDILSVKISEAILIKNDKPVINIKYNELYDFLNLF